MGEHLRESCRMSIVELMDFHEGSALQSERPTVRVIAHDDDDGMVVSLPPGGALVMDFRPKIQAIEVWVEGGSGFELPVQFIHEGAWAHSEMSLDGKPASRLLGWFDLSVECSSKELVELRNPKAILNWKLEFEPCEASAQLPQVILASSLVFISAD